MSGNSVGDAAMRPTDSTTDSTQLYEIIDAFEAAWQSGAPCPIDDCLPDDLGIRREVLVKLIHVELEYRLRAGDAVRVESYLTRFPELAGNAETVLELIAWEYRLRRRGEPDLTLEEYRRRFPQHGLGLTKRLSGQNDSFPINGEMDADVSDPRASQIRISGDSDAAKLIQKVKGVRLEDGGRAPNTVAPDTGAGVSTAPFLAKTDEGAAPGLPTIPGYEILGVLGHGGMGVVYRARQTGLGRLVAIKMILAGDWANRDQVARFRAEGEAIARLGHWNIVQVYEVGEFQGKAFFSLEYVTGGSLDKKLAGSPQPPQEAAAFLETLARAMHVAHERGIIHRDLKPANILLTADGQPKIADFGLAKNLDDAAGRTHTGQIMGTPSYMAPEQATGDIAGIGPATDVYALGAIFYEMLTGRAPFRAPSVLDTLEQVRTQEPVAPRTLQPTVPRDLDTICLKCLQKDRARRYLSALDLADDLRRFHEGRPIAARPVGRIERVVRWARRKPGLAAALAFALIATLATLITLAVAYVLVSESRDDYAFLAVKESYARDQAEKRRRQVEMDAAILHFEQSHAKCLAAETRPMGVAALGRSLQRAMDADAPELAQSIRTHLAAWSRELYPLRRQLSHPDLVLAGAFSPDGKTLLTGCADGAARLWEADTGKLVGAQLNHEGAVSAVAFHRDGITVLTGSADKTARLWNAATGKLLFSLPHPGAVGGAAFSPDGNSILTVCSHDSSARFWAVTTGKPLGPPVNIYGGLWSAAFSPDGKTILAGTVAGTAYLWDIAAGKPRGETPLQQASAMVAGVAFSPDGKSVATASHDRFARMFDAATGKPIGKPLEHDATVRAVAFSADSQSLVTGGGDAQPRLWHVKTGKLLGVLGQHHTTIRAVALSADGKFMLTASEDKTARLWEVAGDRVGASLEHQGVIRARAFSPDGKTIVTGSEDRTARLWDANTGKLLHTLTHPDAVLAVAFVPDAPCLITGSRDKAARLWNTGTGKPIGLPLQHQGPVLGVACAPDGKTLLTGSEDKFARRWDLSIGKLLGAPLQHPGPVTAVAISADGKTVLTRSDDKAARLWNLASDPADCVRLEHQDVVRDVAFSRDGKMVVTGSADTTARLWEVPTGKHLDLELRHQRMIAAVAFSPDGRAVLTSGGDGQARLWDTGTGKLLGPPLQRSAQFVSLAFSPDGRTFATGSNVGIAELWDVTTLKALGSPRHNSDTVVFSPEGKTILLSQGKVARLWKVPSPVQGNVEQLRLWTQAITGLEVDDSGTTILLDVDRWQECCRKLDELGGLPQP